MKTKQKITHRQVEANGRVFTFCIVRTGSSSQSSTQVAIGATVRSPEDADNFKRDRNGEIVKDQFGNPRMIDPNLPNVIAEGRAFKRPVFTFTVAYPIEASNREVFGLANILIDHIVNSPATFFAGYRTDLIRKMKNKSEEIVIEQSSQKTRARKSQETVPTND